MGEVRGLVWHRGCHGDALENPKDLRRRAEVCRRLLFVAFAGRGEEKDGW